MALMLPGFSDHWMSYKTVAFDPRLYRIVAPGADVGDASYSIARDYEKGGKLLGGRLDTLVLS